MQRIVPAVYKNPEKLDEVLGAMYTEMADALGNRLIGVKLFGSYARGDCREESDIDVFVILEDGVRCWGGEEHKALTDISFRYGLENDALFSIVRTNRTPYLEDAYDPLFMNIRAEGIDVDGHGLCHDYKSLPRNAN